MAEKMGRANESTSHDNGGERIRRFEVQIDKGTEGMEMDKGE